MSVVLTEEWSTKHEDIANNYLVSVVLTEELSTEDEDIKNNYLVSVILIEGGLLKMKISKTITWCL